MRSLSATDLRELCQLRDDHDGIAPGYHHRRQHVDAALIRELVEDRCSLVSPEPQENAS